MSGIKITGCSEGTLKALERAQETMEPLVKNLNEVHKALENVRHAAAFPEQNPYRMNFGNHSFLVDVEFINELGEILLGLFLRKEQELNSFEWEIPLGAPKPQEPDDGEHPDLYV